MKKIVPWRKGKWVHSSRRLPPANEAEWKVQVVCQRGSQGWFVSLGTKGNAPFPTVGTGTTASSVEVNTVLFNAMLGVQIGRAGASRVVNPKAGTLKGVIHRAGSWHTRVDVAGWQSRTGSHAYDFHHI